MNFKPNARLLILGLIAPAYTACARTFNWHPVSLYIGSPDIRWDRVQDFPVIQ